MNPETILQIARVCHEANRAFCLTLGDTSQQPWDEAPDWQKESAVNGVRFVLDNPDAQPSDNHDNWLKLKLSTGWKYGPIKDATAKTHPCCVPYDELPPDQRQKDALFRAIVVSFLYVE